MRARLMCALFLLSAFAAVAGEREGWTPTSSDLLFASTREGNSEVYVLRAGERVPVNLTHHDSTDNWPVWSPDGSRIAFQSRRSGNLDVWTMNTDGSDPVRLTSDPEPDYLPAWSPDGASILFTSWRREGGDSVRAPHFYVMSADGSGQRRLVERSPNSSAGATWSPDGEWIVYTRRPDRLGSDVFVADRHGRRERRITRDSARDLHNGSPTFSPDGRWIAFYSDDTKRSALVVVDVEGKRRRTVLGTGKNWYPRWSPDSRWLTYTAAADGGSGTDIDLFAIPVSGKGRPVLLVGGERREQEGSWRP